MSLKAAASESFYNALLVAYGPKNELFGLCDDMPTNFFNKATETDVITTKEETAVLRCCNHVLLLIN